LTIRLSGPAFEQAVQSLARELSGNSDDALTIKLARTAAEAELELTRVRQTRAALIERAIALKRHATFAQRSPRFNGSTIC
jgi:hypothetical protein